MDFLRTDEFLAAKNRRELAFSLRITYRQLMYYLFVASDDERYTTYEIPKKRGGIREICAPRNGLKNIQKEISLILLDLYPAKTCVHGFTKYKGIVSNAKGHSKKKLVLNLDLEDFFPSVNFGRVRGLFLSHPFNFNEEVATALAQVCCRNNCLPQGAPSSPIISNFICRKLDNQLGLFAKNNRLAYSRYADDLTFSSNMYIFPSAVGRREHNIFLLSDKLSSIIKENGFTIKADKIRIADRWERQEVTGIIVNEQLNVYRKYVRHVRAMLNAWEKFGLLNAALEHLEKYNSKGKNPYYPELSYQNEVQGKIGYIGQVKGKDDAIYLKLSERFNRLTGQTKLSIVNRAVIENAEYPVVFCEGKTDAKHLRAALNYFRGMGRFSDLQISFFDYKDNLEINNAELLQICRTRSRYVDNPSKIICLFDCDDIKFNKKVSEPNRLFKYWGRNVYSTLLPRAPHRNFDEVCIEFFYTDEDLFKTDSKNRRLFISTEFETSGSHKTEHLTYVNKNYLKASYPRIIDSNVFKDNATKMALSKNAFATLIESQTPPFDQIDFSHFEAIFNLLNDIFRHDSVAADNAINDLTIINEPTPASSDE